MRQIRRNVFETNSASSHSISIRILGTRLDALTIASMGTSEYGYISPNGTYNLWDSDLTFGRSPFTVLSTFEGKLRYAIASLAYDADKRDEIESIMYEVIPGLTTIRYPTSYNRDTQTRQNSYGYVDHQSCGCLQHFLDKNKVSIRDFLLDTKYVVWIDGDEYRVKNKLIDGGFIHSDDFESL